MFYGMVCVFPKSLKPRQTPNIIPYFQSMPKTQHPQQKSSCGDFRMESAQRNGLESMLMLRGLCTHQIESETAPDIQPTPLPTTCTTTVHVIISAKNGILGGQTKIDIIRNTMKSSNKFIGNQIRGYY